MLGEDNETDVTEMKKEAENQLDKLFDNDDAEEINPTAYKQTFSDDENMDEIMDALESSNVSNVAVKSEQTPNVPNDFNFDQDCLKVFYQKLFPFKLFYRWLSYGSGGTVSKSYFSMREFSFTLPSDAYLRFHSYQTEQELKQDILRLNPIKIDIGAVYNSQPKNKKSLREGVFKPLERELVFDIDMTDYDEIRTCCSGGSICPKCWAFMTISIKIIDRVIRQDFGFKHLLWIYSGRRGVHCWVCDDRARKLTAEGRKAIVGYLEVVKGGEHQTRKVNLSSNSKVTLHPSLLIAQKVLEESFVRDVIIGQDVLGTKENWDKVLALVNDEQTRRDCDVHWKTESDKGRNLSSLDKWGQLIGEVNSQKKKKAALSTTIRDITFQYSYPRLDDHVSTGLNHLLKSPFCIHPKTGRVCVPIDPKKCESFDPFSVPTLTQIVKELDVNGDVRGTSLFPYLEYFKTFLNGIEVETRDIMRQRKAEEDKKMMF